MLCVPVQGRMFPMLAVGRRLIERGHQLTFIGRDRIAAQVKAAGIEFINLDDAISDQPGLAEHKTSALRRFLPWRISRLGSAPYAEATGVRATAISVEAYRHWAALDLDYVPAILDQIPVDALIASESSLAADTIAESRGIPFVTISSGIPRYESSSLPPEFTSWPYRDASWARARNRAIGRLRRLLDLPTLDLLNHVRGGLSLRPYQNLSETCSPLVTLSQLPPGFDFPLPSTEKPVHYVGPILSMDSRDPIPFPWERLGEDPIIYASAGTLSSGEEYFRCIGEACKDMPVQLVITRGGGVSPAHDESFPPSAVVVDYAPQLELLKCASLVITHGSANTVVESLLQGVPVVAIPLIFDQHGVAARLERTGAGISVQLKQARTRRLRSAIEMSLENPAYSEAAARMRDACIEAGGAERAAEIIESVTTVKGS